MTTGITTTQNFQVMPQWVVYAVGERDEQLATGQEPRMLRYFAATQRDAIAYGAQVWDLPTDMVGAQLA